MKASLLLSLIPFLLITSRSQAQTEIKQRIWIPANAKVTKVFTVKDCEEKVDSGYVVKKEYTLKGKENGNTVTYTVTKTDTLQKAKTYPYSKTVNIEMNPNSEGWANIRVDEEDKSIIHVNYWLNPKNRVPKKTLIKVRNRDLLCNKKIHEAPAVFETTDKRRLYYMYRIDTAKMKSDTTTQWFQFADQIIEVFNDKDASKLHYFLVNRWDRSADYQLSLENREFISYATKSIEFGPLVIPFKYHFGYSKNDTIKVSDEFTADLNVGLYIGYKIGKYRVRYENGTLSDLSALSFRFGGFLNLSATSLDKESTKAGEHAFTENEKSSIGILSPGLGFMVGAYNIQMGIFAGIDIGFGHDAMNWNFNGKPWIGFGLAYNVSGLFK